MKYISTRGKAPQLSFEDVLLAGLASDGGLYVPEFLPKFTLEQMNAMRALSYDQLAVEIMYPFVDGCIGLGDFTDIVEETYDCFAHAAVAPLQQLAPNEWVMELFHGPTLAFKDFALQLLGRLLDHFLEKRKQRVAILGATSGDTGSAAIEGCRHSAWVDIFILHPHNRVSEVQRRQMTTVPGDNVRNLALQGDFDDCQRIVKASFTDQSFLGGLPLVAVNSINWCRIMAQIVYYFYAALSLGAPARSITFSVPTGNFGDIYAGYLAREMGLPVGKLIIATNRNDILHRFLSQNLYHAAPLQQTLSPSMDIVVSSNFERLLFDLHGRDGAATSKLMEEMKRGDVTLEDYRWQHARQRFDSCAVTDEMTLAMIRQVFDETGEILDPHTAIGVHACRACREDSFTPMVTLATAHAAKFPEAIEKAGLGQLPSLPRHLADLMHREERYEVVANDLGAVHASMRKVLGIGV